MRERERARGRKRENPKHTLCSAWSPTWGSVAQPWDVQLRKPTRGPTAMYYSKCIHSFNMYNSERRALFYYFCFVDLKTRI